MYVLVGALVVAIFAVVWWLDARRSDRQADDPERLEQDPDAKARRRWRGRSR